MFLGARYDPDVDVIVSWLPLFHGLGMTVSMLFGAELVKITPLGSGRYLVVAEDN